MLLSIEDASLGENAKLWNSMRNFLLVAQGRRKGRFSFFFFLQTENKLAGLNLCNPHDMGFWPLRMDSLSVEIISFLSRACQLPIVHHTGLMD